jgi:D-arabinan exo alpha-(1,3)/(1,5)-arabinofuranosidase (non-reducing end)
LVFDGELRVAMPLADFFGTAEGDAAPVRSLLVGATADDDLYAYFPMPFFESAVVELARDHANPRGKVPVEFAVRRLGRAPHPDSALFGASSRLVESTVPGRAHRVLELEGRGKWVGLFAELGSRSDGSRDYLEGDERVVVDGGPEPLLQGTGVEDFFGGGFYFQAERPGPVPFRHPLHGMTDDWVRADGNAATAMYRLMLVDAPTWSTGVEVDLECGPINQTPIRARTVAYYYATAVSAAARGGLAAARPP